MGNMIHDHSLIYKDYCSLNALLSEPSGCVQILYDALLRDILAISKDERTTLGIYNEALWICTRVLIDSNPELHFKHYFPKEYEPKTYEFVEQRIIKAIVYGVLSLRQSNDFCLQQFLTLFDAGNKEAAPSMKHVYKKLGDWYFLCKRVMNLRPYTEKLDMIEEVLTDKWFLCGEDTCNWLDIVPDQLGDFDPFYTQQILGLVSKVKQKTIINKLWDLITRHEEGLKDNEVISFSIPEKYPEFCRQLRSWHYDYSSVHGKGLIIPPCKQYEEADCSSFDFSADITPPQVPYDMDKAMDYYDEKERDFNNNKLPIIKARIDRWWKLIPEDKREEAIKNKLGDLYDALMKSDFCKYSEAEPDRSYIMEMVSCADDGYQAQQLVDQEVFACAMADFYQNDVDVLDVDKLERYIWVNQKRLTHEQIFAFFTFNAMKVYLSDIMRTSSAEGLVAENTDVLRADDALKVSMVQGKDVVEQEVDRKTDCFLMETFKARKHESTSITLSFKFVPELRNDEKSKTKLKEVLNALNPKINTRGGIRSEKWQWPHVCDALKELGLIDSDTSPTDFGNVINSVLTERTAKSVSQSFKTGRINPDYPTATDRSIIEEIKMLLQSVKDLVDRIDENENDYPPSALNGILYHDLRQPPFRFVSKNLQGL